MPTRLVRDGILSSEAVNSLGWSAEVFFRRLMSVVDDYGRFPASPKLIRAACYPLLIDEVSNTDIEDWLTQCSAAGLVRLYPADGKTYLEIRKFGQQVRSRSKYPPPPDLAADSPPIPTLAHPGEPLQTVENTCEQLFAIAHPDGVENEVVSVGVNVCVASPDVITLEAGQSGVPPKPGVDPPGPDASPPPPGASGAQAVLPDGQRREAITHLLRNRGVKVTAAMPAVCEWARMGVTDTILEQAVSLARVQKPLPAVIPGNYLVPIVASVLNGQGKQGRKRKGEQAYETGTRIDNSASGKVRRGIAEFNARFTGAAADDGPEPIEGHFTRH